jgi:hypothetical protein
MSDVPEDSHSEIAQPTLERWLTGPRFSALPSRAASLPPPLLSFEFFPPKTEALEQQLWGCIRRLSPLRPRSFQSPMVRVAVRVSAPMPRWRAW